MTEDEGRDGAGPFDHVLRLSEFGHPQPARVLAEMRAYWDSLRQGRAVPSRADITPLGLRATLDFSFVLERIAPGAARFRLAGRHLIDLLGMETRGMPLCAVMNPGYRGRLSDVLETVFRAPQIVEADLVAPGGYGRPQLTGKMLLLPLRSDLGDVTRALGCLVSVGEVGAAPRRFDLIADRADPVIEGAQVMVPSPSALGFAEPPTPWRPAAPRPRIIEEETPEERRARFRIISND